MLNSTQIELYELCSAKEQIQWVTYYPKKNKFTIGYLVDKEFRLQDFGDTVHLSSKVLEFIRQLN